MNSEIMSMIQKRLEKGKREYGDQIDVYDGRDWVEETLEEVLDALVYLTAELLKLKDSKKRRKIEVPLYHYKDKNGAYNYDFEAMVHYFLLLLPLSLNLPKRILFHQLLCN